MATTTITTLATLEEEYGIFSVPFGVAVAVWKDIDVKYLAAYLLLNAAGNASPSAADIEKVISSVGIEVDSERVAALLKDLEGKSVDELVAEGTEKLASVPSGGAAPAAAGGAAAGSSDAPAAEEKEEEKEESDDDMGFGLFD